MKKGFTLIELLAVIVILGVLAVITTPVITTSITASKEKAYERQKELIEKAAEEYVSENVNKLGDNVIKLSDNKIGVTVGTLVDEGYLKGDIINPKDNSDMNGCVIITRNGKSFTYTYSDTCS